MHRMIPAFAAMLLAALPASASDKAEQAALAQAARLGEQIFYYDAAAWIGTDDLLAKRPDARQVVRGWIVDGPLEDSELVFYGDGPDGPRMLYSEKFNRGVPVSAHFYGPGDDATLSPARLAMIAARNAASEAIRKAGARPCAGSVFNSVVLPPEKPGAPTLVYFLTPVSQPNSVPAGGHFRVEVAPDGTASEPRAYTRSCIELAKTGAEGKPVALVVSHLLDPLPTEIHVFTMFSAGMPLYVATSANKRTWAIEPTAGKAMIREVKGAE